MKKILLLVFAALAAVNMFASTIVIPEEAKAWNIPSEAIDVTEARALCANLEADVPTTTKYYVMGYVTRISSRNVETVPQYNQARFYLSNEKGDTIQANEFDAYQVYGLNGAKIYNTDVVAVGDFVVLYGPLVKHQYDGGDVSYQTEGKGAAYIWNSTNPKLHNDTPPAQTDQTLVIPEEAKAWNIPDEAIDVLKAREICAGLASGATTGTKYYVMGYVKKLDAKYHVSGIQGYGNATFYMENVKGANSMDDFEAFQVYGPNAQKITDTTAVAVGDFVVVYGELTNYNGTVYETVGKGQAYIWKSTNPLLNNSTPPTPPTLVGEGTVENPYTVEDVLALNNSGETAKYVKGYIVGQVNGKSVAQGLDTVAPFEGDDGKAYHTNLVIASAMGETKNFVPVQLPSGDLRKAFNLVENPDMLGMEVLICGDLMAYFGTSGIKNPTSIEVIGGGDPNVVTVKDLVYTDAYYYEEDSVGYYNLDMYKAYEEDYTYPRLDVIVKAISKTALNGTYELVEATYYASASESVAIGDTAGTVTIKKVAAEEIIYSFIGSYVGTDGKTYKFNQELKTAAYDLDNDEAEIELDETSVAKGKGTKEDPFSVADVIALDNILAGNYYVKGYIIGQANGASISTGLDTEAPFEGATNTDGSVATQGTNLILSDAMNDTINIVPVQLPKGEWRDKFNLVENPNMLGKEVLVYGSLETYFGTAGVKTPTSIELVDVPAGLENMPVGATPVKVVKNGQLMIIRGENVYNVLGARVQ